MPPGGSGAVGLEDYLLLDASGEPIGNVAVVLERDQMRYVVGEVGTPPLRKDRRAYPWSLVTEVDHDRLSVRLATEASDQFIALDPDRAVENGPADARRVSELSVEISGAVSPQRGPVDSPRVAVAIAIGVAALLALLAAVVTIAASESNWRYAALVAPAVLGVAALVALYRMVRKPYE
jgi:hypothetical protein